MTSRRTTSPGTLAGVLAVGLVAAACGGPEGIDGEIRSITKGRDRAVAGDWLAVLDEDSARSWWSLTGKVDRG